MRLRPLLSIALLFAGLTGCTTIHDFFAGDTKKVKIEGERIDIIADDAAITPSPSLADTPVEVPDAVAPESWPQSGGAPNHYAPDLALTFAKETESAHAGDGHEWKSVIVPSPIVTEAAVYAMDGQGYVSAHQKSGLSEIWTSDAARAKSKKFFVGGGLAAGGGKIFVVNGDGRVVALSAEGGKTLWTQELTAPVRAAPLLLDDALVVVTVDSQSFSLDPVSGNIQWQHRGINETASLLGTSTPAAEGPVVVVAYNSGELYALSRRDGSPVWNDSLLAAVKDHAGDAFTGVAGDPVIAGSFVYTISTNATLAANDLRTGLRAWEQKIASHNTPWVSGDFLYVLDQNDTLVCLQRQDGRIKWAQSLVTLTDKQKAHPDDNPAPAYVGPFMLNAQLVLIDPAGKVTILDPKDGKVIDTRDFVEGVTSPPAFADGGMYVMDHKSRLHFVK